MDISLRQVSIALVGLAVESILSLGFITFFGAMHDMIVLSFISVEGIIGSISLISAIVAFIVFVLIWRLESTVLDDRFKNLAVYYSPEILEPTKKTEIPICPRYIVNIPKSQAYRVSGLIEPFINKMKNRYTCDNEASILAALAEQNVAVKKKSLTFEDLDLWLKPNGFLVKLYPMLKPEMLEKLEKRKQEGKLKPYQLVYLNPWFCWFRLPYVDKLIYPPRRRIIVNVETAKAYKAPQTALDMAYKLILHDERYSPRPWEDITKWCKRKKQWTFLDENLTEEQLAGDYQ
jgi:hypothetical protein